MKGPPMLKSPASLFGRLAVPLVCVAMGLSVTSAAIQAHAGAPTSPAAQQYRPLIHYSPRENWMNDPNGLIRHKGIYHLFYQYNALGSTGGNASWGHATSKDLTHWVEQPVAIPMDQTEEVWSGSVVYDEANTSGLGTGQGPLVAIYTSAVKATGVQRQSIAYSNDDGATWTKYADNPVLDIGSHNFRDPKVFQYTDGTWRMVVVLSDQHKVSIYSSADLKTWKHESDFGPAGVTTNVWECPDLYPMQLDGDPAKVRWVMSLSVGGRVEYFVGDFDGRRFTTSETSYSPPVNSVISDFESGYQGWTTTGTAFGSAPVTGDAAAAGAHGSYWVDSWGGSDTATGTLTSPTFTIDEPYLNFLIAGGNHPRVLGGLTEPPPGTVIADFEGDTLPGWVATGDFVGITPSHPNLSGQVGSGVLDTCWATCDPAQGTITSPQFTVTARWLDLLIAGGDHPADAPNPTTVNVLVGGQVVASTTGNNSGSMDWRALDLAAYQGQTAQVQVVDANDGSSGWGHIMVDQITLSDVKATGWDAQTGANLLVNGQIVRTATGNNSGQLDWTSWNVADLQGKSARIEIVDHNTGGWGHTLADYFVLASAPAQSTIQRAKWIDHGSDFYAGVTFNGLPIDKRIMIAWMNNWDYANGVPTSPWRGVQSLPRALSLVTSPDGGRIVQQPVKQVDQLAANASYKEGTSTLSSTKRTLPRAAWGTTQRIDLAIRPGTATTAGIQVFADDTSATIIGWDASSQRLYLDRTDSGNTSFNASFPRVDSAPARLDATGTLRLRIYLDRSTVEVFTADGKVAISDTVFPHEGARAIRLFAEGGTAQVVSVITVPLRQSMFLR